MGGGGGVEHLSGHQVQAGRFAPHSVSRTNWQNHSNPTNGQNKSAKFRNPTNRQNKLARSAEFGRRLGRGGGGGGSDVLEGRKGGGEGV